MVCRGIVSAIPLLVFPALLDSKRTRLRFGSTNTHGSPTVFSFLVGNSHPNVFFLFEPSSIPIVPSLSVSCPSGVFCLRKHVCVVVSVILPESCCIYRPSAKFRRTFVCLPSRLSSTFATFASFLESDPRQMRKRVTAAEQSIRTPHTHPHNKIQGTDLLFNIHYESIPNTTTTTTTKGEKHSVD
jgi:hypothetical protein